MALPPLDFEDFVLPQEPWDPLPLDPNWWHRDRDVAFAKNIQHWYGEEWLDRIFMPLGTTDPVPRSWYGVRPLGRGGQGWAAMYERRHPRTGAIIDQVALKETQGDDQRSKKCWTDDTPPVPSEAAVMAQANTKGNRNIVQLRSFKRYRNKSRRLRYRYYVEYCPHGDFTGLIYRYRQFGEFLPELFIWHVFNSLAKVLQTFEHARWAEIRGALKGVRMEANYLVHFDIKTHNIFLADPDPENDHPSGAIRTYPTVKVGDFGMARITNNVDFYNPADYAGGTTGMRPPEQADLFENLDSWWPAGRPKPWADYGGFDTKLNTFAVGEVIWELLFLKRFELDFVLGSGDSFDDGHMMDTIRTMRGSTEKPGKKVNRKKEEEYSFELRDLVRQCLHPDPRQRPTSDDLRLLTSYHLERTLELEPDRVRRYQTGPRRGEAYASVKNDPHRVYYRGNEINDMEPGTLHISLFGQNDGQHRRLGWVQEAHLHRQPGRIDSEADQWKRFGQPNEPIIFPKLRWNPEQKEFWLMKKRQRHASRHTRWRTSAPPPGRYDVFEDWNLPWGNRVVKKVVKEFDPKDREKDVWIFGRNEFGTFAEETAETALAKQSHWPIQENSPPRLPSHFGLTDLTSDDESGGGGGGGGGGGDDNDDDSSGHGGGSGGDPHGYNDSPNYEPSQEPLNNLQQAAGTQGNQAEPGISAQGSYYHDQESLVWPTPRSAHRSGAPEPRTTVSSPSFTSDPNNPTPRYPIPGAPEPRTVKSSPSFTSDPDNPTPRYPIPDARLDAALRAVAARAAAALADIQSSSTPRAPNVSPITGRHQSLSNHRSGSPHGLESILNRPASSTAAKRKRQDLNDVDDGDGDIGRLRRIKLTVKPRGEQEDSESDTSSDSYQQDNEEEDEEDDDSGEMDSDEQEFESQLQLQMQQLRETPRLRSRSRSQTSNAAVVVAAPQNTPQTRLGSRSRSQTSNAASVVASPQNKPKPMGKKSIGKRKWPGLGK